MAMVHNSYSSFLLFLLLPNRFLFLGPPLTSVVLNARRRFLLFLRGFSASLASAIALTESTGSGSEPGNGGEFAYFVNVGEFLMHGG